jgi:hypothetical protein
MLPADYPFQLRPRQTRPTSPHWSRVLAITLSLAVHLAVLARLLAAPDAIHTRPRAEATDSNVLEVVLLDPEIPVSAPLIPSLQRPTTTPVQPRRKPPLSQPEPPSSAPAQTDQVSEVPPATITSAQLFNGIEAAARDLTAGDPRLPGAGMPSALARLPGSADAIVDLPVRFKRRPTPQQITLFALRILVGTMASNPDDMEQVRTMRNPLQDLTDAHIQGIKDPECNDPEDPLRDPRCYPPPPR